MELGKSTSNKIEWIVGNRTSPSLFNTMANLIKDSVDRSFDRSLEMSKIISLWSTIYNATNSWR